jgi:arginine/lysine/ornithine decarboxylase
VYSLLNLTKGELNLFTNYKQALGDVANEEHTFGYDKYREEIDTVDLKEALGKINSSVVVNYP